VIRGKYRVEGLIGQGGMAYVVAAWHLHLEQRVAIKLHQPGTYEQGVAVVRFLREARVLSRLEGDHFARVLDVDTLESGPPFIVMEYLEGADLSRLLRERGPLPLHEIAGWVRQACVALEQAHAMGIIHRDIKPANVFLAQKRGGEAVIKVLDFGISKLIEQTRITQEAVGMGSAEYTSPEQMRSAYHVDARGDLWSLGVVMYELATGVTPFHADGIGEVAAAVLLKDPLPPRQLRPDLLPAFEAVILRCLEKDPARRFASAAALGAALAPFTRALASPALAAPATSTARAAPAVPALPWRSIAAGVAVAVIATGVVVAAFLIGRRGASPAAVAAARFTLDADTLHDTATKLTWQRAPARGNMDWASAKAYCARQSGSLRLPEADELDGLLAVTRVSPPIDAAGFPTEPSDVFWSATPAGPGAAVVVHFSKGGSRGTSVISGRNRVRCVR
jgi:serine/threonine-protein kinase